MGNTQATFYFDFISPFAYLAWLETKDMAEHLSLSFRPVPVLFARFLNHYGNKGPAEIPSKKIYMFQQVSRIAAAKGWPMSPPPNHPFNPLLSLRLATLLQDTPDMNKLVDALFAAVWNGGGGAEDVSNVEAILMGAGFDGARLVKEANESPNKAKLRQNTEEALAKGVFGVPTVFVKDQMFWGFDSLPHVEMFLGGQDPCQSAEWHRWKGIQPSATRKK